MNIYKASQGFEKLKSSLVRASAIYITDNETVLIENCSEIEEFGENVIKAVLKKCAVTITGLDLSVKSFNNSSVSIHGKLHSIDFIEKE